MHLRVLSHGTIGHIFHIHGTHIFGHVITEISVDNQRDSNKYDSIQSGLNICTLYKQ